MEIMFKTLFYLLIAISIAPQYLHCYTVNDEDASIKTSIHIVTDDKDLDYSTSSAEAANNPSDTSPSTGISDDTNTSAFELSDAANYTTKDVDNNTSDPDISGRKKYGGYGGGNNDGYGGGGYGKHKHGKFGKLGKRKKISKIFYPILVGFIITKMILFPLFVKAVTIMSSSAYVFSKMSLLASLIFGLKLFLTNNNNHNSDNKVEIVHVPLKKFGHGPDWDRDATDSKINNIVDGIYEQEYRQPL